VPYSVAANAPSAGYKMSLMSPTGRVLFSSVAASEFLVLDEPQISSISPTVMQRGKAYTITVRGTGLQNVRNITLENSNGTTSGITLESSALVVTTDGFGQAINVRLVLDAATALGPIVLRLNHAGGITSSQATTANTINIVNP
jgi:IPT/TIG domain